MKSFTLGKNYKLCSKEGIKKVLDQGVSIKCYPYIARFTVEEWDDNTPFKFVISAPKRKFKTAVQRNRLKRVIKEAIRLHKPTFEDQLAEHNQQLAIFIIYTANEEITTSTLRAKTNSLFDRIIQNLVSHEKKPK